MNISSKKNRAASLKELQTIPGIGERLSVGSALHGFEDAALMLIDKRAYLAGAVGPERGGQVE